MCLAGVYRLEGTCSMMAAQHDVVIAFLGAFAGFSAFGAVIATFLASSDALPRFAAWWGARARAEAEQLPTDRGRDEAMRWAGRRRVILLWSAGAAVALAALVSGLGLVTSFLWLHAWAGGGAVGWGWAYRWTGYLLVIEVVLITAITVLAMGTAVWFAVKTGPKTEDVTKPAAPGGPPEVPGPGGGTERAIIGPARS